MTMTRSAMLFFACCSAPALAQDFVSSQACTEYMDFLDRTEMEIRNGVDPSAYQGIGVRSFEEAAQYIGDHLDDDLFLWKNRQYERCLNGDFFPYSSEKSSLPGHS